jgi:predicted deacylase
MGDTFGGEYEHEVLRQVLTVDRESNGSMRTPMARCRCGGYHPFLIAGQALETPLATLK